MAFIEYATNDPVLRRGQLLGRCGSAIPALCWAAMNLGFVIMSPFAKVYPSRSMYVFLCLLFTVVGQAIVWGGMNTLRRCEGWDSGIVSYLWSGGFATSLVVGGTGILPLTVIPWIAPITASVAKRRLLRRKRLKGGARA